MLTPAPEFDLVFFIADSEPRHAVFVTLIHLNSANKVES